MTYDPEKDGIDHLNVYSKGRTELGRFLSNFAYAPVETEDGHFDSIEGYWYWLSTNSILKDELRHVHGSRAKELGRQLRGEDWNSDPEFIRKICAAIRKKIESNPLMRKALTFSCLPLAHYYVMQGGKVIEPQEGKWVIQFIEDLRKEYQAQEIKNIWDWHRLGYWVVVTTNLQTRKDGKAVMGVGLAKQAADKFPELPVKYGQHLLCGGNGFFLYAKGQVICVPTKDHWMNSSNLTRIRSCVAMLSKLPAEIEKVAVPPLGCGFGGLSWKDVEPLLRELPEDRFKIIPPSCDDTEKWRA